MFLERVGLFIIQHSNPLQNMHGHFLAVPGFFEWESVISREYGLLDREHFVNILHGMGCYFIFDYNSGEVWCEDKDFYRIPLYESRFAGVVREGNRLNPIDLTGE